MKAQFSIKDSVIILLQIMGAAIGFIVCLIASNAIAPLPNFITDGTPTAGFMPSAAAMVFNGLTNAVLLVWVARRSSTKGLGLVGQLFVLSFVAQALQTQIETGYFISAFPLLNNNFVVYQLVLRGLITSGLLAGLVAAITGGFTKAPRPAPNFEVSVDRAVRQSAWLAVMYLALYMLFGYYIAWQSQELRVFYGGPAVLNSFVDQWSASLMGKPELPIFQYFRGFLWVVCLIPLFRAFTGKRLELVVVSALALGLLPTAQLAFANPLMPASVSLYHFWEVALSTGIFGALCAWFVPRAVSSLEVGVSKNARNNLREEERTVKTAWRRKTSRMARGAVVGEEQHDGYSSK